MTIFVKDTILYMTRFETFAMTLVGIRRELITADRQVQPIVLSEIQFNNFLKFNLTWLCSQHFKLILWFSIYKMLNQCFLRHINGPFQPAAIKYSAGLLLELVLLVVEMFYQTCRHTSANQILTVSVHDTPGLNLAGYSGRISRHLMMDCLIEPQHSFPTYNSKWLWYRA